MKYLHDRNIIHRDLKSGNILLDENFHPLITDFGLSKIFDMGHSKSQTQFAGTLIYMAPEIIEEDEYDRKADVYSFGILMYEIVTDLFPYPELQNGEMKKSQFQRNVVKKNLRPEFKYPVKKEMQELIEQCWSKDPNDRPTFKEIFNKLTNRNRSYFLDGVDEDEVDLYIEDITETTDPIEELHKQNAELEREIQQLSEENESQKSRIETLVSNNEKLTTANKNLLADQSKQAKEIQQLKAENSHLKTENSQLKTENSQLKTENSQLKTENSQLKTENSQLKTENSQLKTENSKFKTENLQLKTENSKPKKQESSSKKQESSFKKQESSSKRLKSSSEDKVSKKTEVSTSNSNEFFIFDSELLEKLLRHSVVIGEGAVSSCYKVENSITGNGHLCLKIMKKGSYANFEAMHHFINEYEIIYSLNHPNIIKACGLFFGDEHNMPAMLLEYCEHDLEYAIHHKFNDYILVAIIYEIVSTMKYVHENNIMHRDVKVSNILIDSFNHVKIIDFSISRRMDLDSSLTRGVGTLRYMAPELINEEEYDEKIDVFAFGVVLYFICTKGKLPPFSVRTSYESLDLPPTINDLSRSIIKKCWATSPKNRPSFSELLDLIVKNNFMLINGINDKIPEIKRHLGI